MKFWELVSIFRPNTSALEELLEKPEWFVYLKWFKELTQHVNSQNRSILDAVVPEQLIVGAMERCDYHFRIQDGSLYRCLEHSSDALNAVDVHRRYGAAAIEEVLEFGSFPIPSAPQAIG